MKIKSIVLIILAFLATSCQPAKPLVITTTPSRIPCTQTQTSLQSFPSPNPYVALTLTAIPENLDKLSLSFISGVPCYAPCLLGVTPGMIDEANEIDIFSNLDGLENCQIFVKLGIVCDNANLDVNEDGFVESISILPESLSIGLIVDTYGPPDTVLVVSNGRAIEVILYFHDLNVIVDLPALSYADRFEFYTIDPNTNVFLAESVISEIYWVRFI